MLITAQGRSHGELFVSQVEEKSCKGCSFQGLSILDVHVIEKELFLFMEKNEETLKLQLFCQHRRGKATVKRPAC